MTNDDGYNMQSGTGNAMQNEIVLKNFQEGEYTQERGTVIQGFIQFLKYNRASIPPSSY
jgi:hypothetical protein